MKRTISVFIFIVTIFAFSFPAFAVESTSTAGETVSGVTQDGFVYKIENGKATVTGYNGKDKEIEIPSKINEYPVVALEGLSSAKITKLVIPEGVERIGSENDDHFDCGFVEKISISKTVTSISCGLWIDNALSEITVSTENKSFICINNILYNKNIDTLLCCVSSASVCTVPDTVKCIGKYAFHSCAAETVFLPNSLEEIGYGAFMGGKIKSVVIPNSVKHIGQAAFKDSMLESLSLGSGIVGIDEYVFSGTKLSQVTIPGNILSIGKGAFSRSNLKSVIIQDGVSVIDEEAFSSNPMLKNIVLPSSVTEIANSAFDIYSGVAQTPGEAAEMPDVKFEGTKEQWQRLISVANPLFVADVVFTNEQQLTNEPLNMFYKGTTKLNSRIDGELLWISSDSSIVKVDMNGSVTAVGKGTANVQAVSPDGSSEAFEITVSYEWWQWLIIIFALGFLWYI